MMRRAILPAMVACGLAAGSASAQLGGEREERITAADGTPFLLTHGMVRVPERRPWKDGDPTIELAVVRVRRVRAEGQAGGRDERPRHAHVVLAGGPGDSGVRIALGMARQGGAALADLLDADVVGIDQRGTGGSRPNLAVRVPYRLPREHPGSPDTWLPLMQDAVHVAVTELTARGIRLDAYTTRESADDVEGVRRALGYQRLTLWGRSYGSHLALAVLRQHGSHVDRVVLVGPEGPDHTWKSPALVDAVLGRIAERGGGADLLSDIRRVIDRLAGEPVTVTVPHPLTRQPATVGLGAFDVQWLTAQALGDPRALATLPSAFRRMAGGDFTAIAPLILLRRERAGIESALPALIDASSGASPARRARIETEARTALLGRALDFPVPALAAWWGARDLGDDFRAPVTSDVPVLILAGDLDARTPVENGRDIAATLANGQLVVVENAAHQFDVFGSAPIRAILAAFLRGSPLPAARVTVPPISFAP